MTRQESFFTKEELGLLALSFMLLKGGEATQEEILGFMKKCDAVIGLADQIRQAARGEILIGWSEEENSFIFQDKSPGDSEADDESEEPNAP